MEENPSKKGVLLILNVVELRGLTYPHQSVIKRGDPCTLSCGTVPLGPVLTRNTIEYLVIFFVIE